MSGQGAHRGSVTDLLQNVGGQGEPLRSDTENYDRLGTQLNEILSRSDLGCRLTEKLVGNFSIE